VNVFFIINPLSGSGKAVKLWNKLHADLDIHQIKYSFAYTEYATHATALALAASQNNFDVLVVLGGDGTLHEAANGLLINEHNKTALSVLPVGTGNDFASAYSINRNTHQFIRRLKEPKFIKQDVLEIRGDNGFSKFCVSMCGIGFDAFIAREANLKKKKGSRGKLIYITSAIKAVFNYKPVILQINDSHKNHTETVLTMALGIHKTNGGGLIQCPHATPNDGLMSITIIKPLSFFDVIRIVPLLLNGKLLTHHKVISFNTDRIQISAHSAVPVETDGEDAGNLPLTFMVKQNALTILR
jgi:YegS/Rv2252/BmrU family lipid kinase